jgi:hypothetical protein
MNNEKNTQLYQLSIRLSKSDAAFFYFTLESNEGVAFYSTLETPKDQNYRDILVTCHRSQKAALENIITQCQKKFPIEILKAEWIEDKL